LSIFITLWTSCHHCCRARRRRGARLDMVPGHIFFASAVTTAYSRFGLYLVAFRHNIYLQLFAPRWCRLRHATENITAGWAAGRVSFHGTVYRLFVTFALLLLRAACPPGGACSIPSQPPLTFPSPDACCASRLQHRLFLSVWDGYWTFPFIQHPVATCHLWHLLYLRHFGLVSWRTFLYC